MVRLLIWSSQIVISQRSTSITRSEVLMSFDSIWNESKIIFFKCVDVAAQRRDSERISLMLKSWAIRLHKTGLVRNHWPIDCCDPCLTDINTHSSLLVSPQASRPQATAAGIRSGQATSITLSSTLALSLASNTRGGDLMDLLLCWELVTVKGPWNVSGQCIWFM